jgi:hypothetical protein
MTGLFIDEPVYTKVIDDEPRHPPFDGEVQTIHLDSSPVFHYEFCG